MVTPVRPPAWLAQLRIDRFECGASLRELARRSGIPAPVISAILKAEVIPTRALLVELAVAMGPEGQESVVAAFDEQYPPRSMTDLYVPTADGIVIANAIDRLTQAVRDLKPDQSRHH